MALSPDYIPMTPLWELFSDKDTGELLRSGYAKFYRDTARTTGKTVFKLTGSPPNYTYIPYGFTDTDGGWRIDLNDQGAWDSIVYGYPFDDDGGVDLYFIQFYSMDDVFQFSREGWPNFISTTTSPTQAVDINFIPNGQFRLHLDLPVSQNYEAGQIRAPITPIAYGGWTFERPAGSTARDFVTFKRFSAYTALPEKSPRYEIEIVCESPLPGDAYKDLRVKFDDVNKFADPVNEFTFAITGKIAGGGNINVELILIKNYGTGGDTTQEISLTTFSITSSYQVFSYSFNFGTNVGKSIGPLDDDFIQLALRFPVDNIFDAVFSDAILTPGTIENPIFDDTTTRQFIYQSMFAEICPPSDGSDIGLPLALTREGIIYDDSTVGQIYAQTTELPQFGFLLADGAQYETESYSADGIPYSRLQNKLKVSTTGLMRYGTGRDFLTAYYTNFPIAVASASLRISTNKTGTVTDTSDGTPATGFTFNNVSSGSVDSNCFGLMSGNSSFYIWVKTIGTIGASISAGTSGFTASLIRETTPGTSLVKNIYKVVTVAATALAGTYFEYYNATVGFYVWYKVDGVGTDPAVGLTGIQVDLLSTWNAGEVAKATAEAVSGFKISNIITVAGSAVPSGSYFNLNTIAQDYYVWYSVNAGGTDPAPFGKLPIKVSILSSDTAIVVAQKTLLAINAKYFAVPDLRGMFLRGWNNSANIDTDFANRWSFYDSDLNGDNLGTFEFDEITQHMHTTSATIENASGTSEWFQSNNLPEGIPGTTSYSGGSESRPINTYVNYVIKY